MNQTSEPKVEGNGLFPTPMMHLTFPDSQRINGELSAVITKRMADHPSNNHSNLGGWQSSWDKAAH